MKILIIGPLGAGKSSLAYTINKKFNLPRLNLDEICRNPKNGHYFIPTEQLEKLNTFLQSHEDWVAEGCQKYLYEKTNPDVIIDMRINRLVAIIRFTYRFWKAKKLIGQQIDKNLPVQAYHYRKTSLSKILDWDSENRKINREITEFLQNKTIPIIRCQSFKDYPPVFQYTKQHLSQKSRP